MLDASTTAPHRSSRIVQGHALGGGCGLVACCDIVVAEPAAQFAFSEVKLGIVPAVISPFALAKIGSSAARRYFVTGERFTADVALRIGLVHEVARRPRRSRRPQCVLDELLSAGPDAARAAKLLARAPHSARGDRRADRRPPNERRRTGGPARVPREAPAGLGAATERPTRRAARRRARPRPCTATGEHRDAVAAGTQGAVEDPARARDRAPPAVSEPLHLQRQRVASPRHVAASRSRSARHAARPACARCRRPHRCRRAGARSSVAARQRHDELARRRGPDMAHRLPAASVSSCRRARPRPRTHPCTATDRRRRARPVARRASTRESRNPSSQDRTSCRTTCPENRFHPCAVKAPAPASARPEELRDDAQGRAHR